MRTRLFLTSLLCVIALFSFGQEPLNQLDSLGKKNGKWIVYLDRQWNKADSSNAVYYRYTWYEHGVNIHPMGAGGGKNCRMESSNAAQTAGLQLLDGEYKWYDEKGKLRYVHVLKNGEYVMYKEFFPSGELQTVFDYTKKCEGQPHSWCALIYDKKGNLVMTSWTCRDKNGKWPKMKG